MSNTVLTNALGYDASMMTFEEPKKTVLPAVDGKGAGIQFYRVNIGTKNPDGTTGDLILSTERCFSFGVSENVSKETGNTTGWVLPLCLHDKNAPTEEQIAWVDTFGRIVEKCVDHIMEVKDDIEKEDLVRTDLRKLSPLYYKKEKVQDKVTGKTVTRNVEGAGPTLYAKLIYSKKSQKFVSRFYDSNDEPIDPFTLTGGRYGFARAAIKIESIFIGAAISIQVKVYECEYELADRSYTRLLTREPAEGSSSDLTVEAKPTATRPAFATEDDVGSINGDEEEKKPAVRRTIKKTVKKTSNDE